MEQAEGGQGMLSTPGKTLNHPVFFCGGGENWCLSCANCELVHVQ